MCLGSERLCKTLTSFNDLFSPFLNPVVDDTVLRPQDGCASLQNFLRLTKLRKSNFAKQGTVSKLQLIKKLKVRKAQLQHEIKGLLKY